MQIQATDEQAQQMALNAINASVPVGMGFLHAEAKDYTLEDLDKDNLRFDYFHGRMVKFSLRKETTGLWNCSRGDEPHPEYQSWYRNYPTLAALAESVGASVIEKTEDKE